jgi:hypothetical protein
MDNESKQLWLSKEWEEEHDRIKRHDIGKKISDPDVYKVPNIITDQGVREMLKKWPIEMSSRRIRILAPYAMYANLEPKDILDFENIQGIDSVHFSKVDEQTVKMSYIINGSQKEDYLILRENGKVEHKWGIK